MNLLFYKTPVNKKELTKIFLLIPRHSTVFFAADINVTRALNSQTETKTKQSKNNKIKATTSKKCFCFLNKKSILRYALPNTLIVYSRMFIQFLFRITDTHNHLTFKCLNNGKSEKELIFSDSSQQHTFIARTPNYYSNIRCT